MKFHSAKAERISVEWQEVQSCAGAHGCEGSLINLKVLKQESDETTTEFFLLNKHPEYNYRFCLLTTLIIAVPEAF